MQLAPMPAISIPDLQVRSMPATCSDGMIARGVGFGQTLARSTLVGAGQNGTHA
jgi:hypothetical protein